MDPFSAHETSSGSAAAYIAVHGGAGVHDQGSEKEVKKAMREACLKAMASSSRTGSSALTMTEDAICVLEDSPYLNAGLGSNLTLDGTVECDASIMAGSSNAFGSVGAISGIKNPIRIARSILEYSSKVDDLGRIPPLTLVSTGATSFAASYAGIHPVPNSFLITDDAYRRWQKWKSRMDAPEMHVNPFFRYHYRDETREIQDTVGAVALHPQGGVAAGVSSGGMLLKLPGRVGEAGVYGAGCWAQESDDPRSISVACSVSGTGEHIVRAQLAKSVAEKVASAMETRLCAGGPDVDSQGEDSDSEDEGDSDDDSQEGDSDSGDEAEMEDMDHPLDPHVILQRVLEDEFWEPFYKEGEISPSAGVILLTKEVDEEEETIVRLWCAFTTPSMAIGYASPKHPKAKAVILRHPDARTMRDEGRSRIFITAVPL